MMKGKANMDKGTQAELSRFPVTFGSGEAKLAGEILFPNKRHPVPGAILCHGFGSSYRAVEAGARIIANCGVAVLIFDFRGHGGSGGILDGNIVVDVVDAWHFLSDFPGIDRRRIALAGHSMGAMAAILAARQVNPHALIALSCPPELGGKLADVASFLLENWVNKDSGFEEYRRDGVFPWLKGPFALLWHLWVHLAGYQQRVDWRGFLEVVTRAKMSTALCELKNCSKLFVHCQGDSLTPYQAVLELYKKAEKPKGFLFDRGGFHSAPLLPGSLRAGWTRWVVATLMTN